jgi:hypothetical protein
MLVLLLVLRRRRVGARLRDRCRRQEARRLNVVLRGDSAHAVVHLGDAGGHLRRLAQRAVHDAAGHVELFGALAERAQRLI